MVFGQKWLGMWGGVLVLIALAMHPATLPGAAYYLVQLPVMWFLETTFFPLNP